MIMHITPKRIYFAIISGAQKIIEDRNYLNSINVFPVKDGDTGSNLSSTMTGIINSSRIEKSVAGTVSSIAMNALNGARGNSGSIFAQFLSGLAEALPENSVRLKARDISDSLKNAVDELYASMSDPVEGTILTVMRRSVEKFKARSEQSTDLSEILDHSFSEAEKALRDTSEMLPVLKKEKVVDAGAKAFVDFIAGIRDFIKNGNLRNKEIEIPDSIDIDQDIHNFDEDDEIEYRYCCEGFIELTESVNIKEKLKDYGDSLVAAHLKNKARIHIHTNDPDQVFEQIESWGYPLQIKIEDMLRQYQSIYQKKRNIAIVTDSAADLPKELIEKHQIHVIPFQLNFGEKLYLDKLSISSDRFYEKLQTEPIHPQSSVPPLAAIKSVYESLSEKYEHVIGVHISSHLSGMYRVVSETVQQFKKNNITIIDSKNLSSSQGLMVLKLAEAVEDRLPTQVAIDHMMSTDHKILVDLDTLKYMVRGGRISGFKGLLARILNLKPIVSLTEEGKGLPIDKSFSRDGNMKNILGRIKNAHLNNQITRYAIVHADAQERAFDYQKKIKDITGIEAEYVMPVSPVVGAHNGPGVVGIAFELQVKKQT